MVGELDLTVMEPLAWTAPFDAAGWISQVKWDGVRMLVVNGGDSRRLVNRRGHLRSEQYPELLDLAEGLPGETVLDGEVVALIGGKPSFSSVMQRDQGRSQSVIRRNLAAIPVTYFAFDLLYAAGQDLRPLPWSDRQARLAALWPGNGPSRHLVESFPSGTGLYAAVAEQSLEGIVSKRQDSAYWPGKKSDAWRKIKLFRSIDCLVGGFTTRLGLPSALLLGLWRDQKLVYIGAAGSGLSESDWRALLPFLRAAEQTQSAFVVSPRLRDRAVHWVVPSLSARVKFMEWSADLKLRAPVIVGLQSAASVDCSFTAQGV